MNGCNFMPLERTLNSHAILENYVMAMTTLTIPFELQCKLIWNRQKTRIGRDFSPMKLMAALFVFVITAPFKNLHSSDFTATHSSPGCPGKVYYLTVHYMVDISQDLYENKCRRTVFSIYSLVSSIYSLQLYIFAISYIICKHLR